MVLGKVGSSDKTTKELDSLDKKMSLISDPVSLQLEKIEGRKVTYNETINYLEKNSPKLFEEWLGLSTKRRKILEGSTEEIKILEHFAKEGMIPKATIGKTVDLLMSDGRATEMSYAALAIFQKYKMDISEFIPRIIKSVEKADKYKDPGVSVLWLALKNGDYFYDQVANLMKLLKKPNAGEFATTFLAEIASKNEKYLNMIKKELIKVRKTEDLEDLQEKRIEWLERKVGLKE
ncbi:MAG: hypothetical protein AABX38_02725 [Candidatus Micrarchaeota archaeon]